MPRNSLIKSITVLCWLIVFPVIAQSNDALRGKVVDAETREPLSEVFVVAFWEKSPIGIGHSSSYCYIVDVAETDENGEYLLRDAPRKFPFKLIPPAYTYIHKKDYQMDADFQNEGYRIVVHSGNYPYGSLTKNKHDADLRIRYLDRLTEITSCYSAGSKLRKLIPIYRLILDEAMEVAVTEDHKNIIKGICEDLAYVSVRKDGHPNSSIIDQEISEYISQNLPECLEIEVDFSIKDAFLQHVRSGNIEAVLEMINGGFDLETRFDGYKTALFISSLEGNARIARLLLVNGANPNVMDGRHKTILQSLISSNELSEQRVVEIMSTLLEYGANPHLADAWNKTAFNDAVAANKINAVKLMIESGANVNNLDTSPKGNYSLYYRNPPIIEAKSIAMMDILVAAGADINLPGEYGYTALMEAVTTKNLEKLQYLIDHKADVNQNDFSNQSPLVYAVKKCVHGFPNDKTTYQEIIEKLISAGAYTEPLELIDQSGDCFIAHGKLTPDLS